MQEIFPFCPRLQENGFVDSRHIIWSLFLCFSFGKTVEYQSKSWDLIEVWYKTIPKSVFPFSELDGTRMKKTPSATEDRHQNWPAIWFWVVGCLNVSPRKTTWTSTSPFSAACQAGSSIISRWMVSLRILSVQYEIKGSSCDWMTLIPSAPRGSVPT